jgi:hypothetical protein
MYRYASAAGRQFWNLIGTLMNGTLRAYEIYACCSLPSGQVTMHLILGRGRLDGNRLKERTSERFATLVEDHTGSGARLEVVTIVFRESPFMAPR